MNSRPLDPQSSALPAAPHPVIPEFSLLSAYRLFANRRGASFRNIVAVLRLERSFRSLFLHLGAMPSSATGGGISPRPAAPHPVIPEFSLLSAYRLFANRRGASFRNIVAVLRLERSFRSLFLHLGAMPSSATGGGISPRPAAPHPESSSIIPHEKRFGKSFFKLF